MKRKRKLDDDEAPPTSFTAERGGGHGIYRKNAHKQDFDFDYGSEYRAKVFGNTHYVHAQCMVRTE